MTAAVDAGPAAPGCLSAAPTPLRLLTRAEYDHTVRDLLGDASGASKDFPREPLSQGFDNDATIDAVSAEGVSRYLEAAEALSASTLRLRRERVVPCTSDDADCRDRFLLGFGRSAWRRPLTSLEQAGLTSFFDGVRATGGFDAGVELTLQVLLQSPQFLYRDEQAVPGAPASRADLDDFQLATRLSYFIWASTPDEALLDAAEAGMLRGPEGLRAQAERLLDDPRALEGELRFFSQWLSFDLIATAEKDLATYPSYSPALARAWRRSLELYVREVLGREGTLAALLTEDVLFANDAMNAYVGGGMASDFQRVVVPGSKRRGLLAQPGLLARLAGPNQSSPIRRGAFVLEKLMCQPSPAPPAGLVVTPPLPSPASTTRERWASHSASPACAGCHKLIDPIGFTMEHFDGVGAWRDTENGKPIDATGGVVAAKDPSLVAPVTDVNGLTALLARSRQAHDCVAAEYLRFALGRALGEGDTCSLASVQQRFMESGGTFRALVLAIVQSDAFASHAAPGAAP